MADKHLQYMEIARATSLLSKDRRKKVGALFVDSKGGFLSSGYNGFPRGANDDIEERQEGDLKQKVTVHAETNAIYQAARRGISLEGSRLYITTLPPCIECTKAIIQVGCTEVFIEAHALLSKDWTVNWDLTKQLFEECGVKVRVLP